MGKDLKEFLYYNHAVMVPEGILIIQNTNTTYTAETFFHSHPTYCHQLQMLLM